MRSLAFVAVTALAACKSDPPSTATLPDLSSSLDAVRAEFAAHAHEARFLTLLAPT